MSNSIANHDQLVQDELLKSISSMLPEISSIISDFAGTPVRYLVERDAANTVELFNDTHQDNSDPRDVCRWYSPDGRQIGVINTTSWIRVWPDGLSKSVESNIRLKDSHYSNFTIRSARHEHTIKCQDVGDLPLNLVDIYEKLYEHSCRYYSFFDRTAYILRTTSAIVVAVYFHNQHLPEEFRIVL